MRVIGCILIVVAMGLIITGPLVVLGTAPGQAGSPRTGWVVARLGETPDPARWNVPHPVGGALTSCCASVSRLIYRESIGLPELSVAVNVRPAFEGGV